MAKLYPPVIEGTIPAFYGTTLVVPFSMNRAVAKSDIKGFSLKIKTVQTNTFVKNLTSTNYTTSEVTFNTSDLSLTPGQYYKLQLAYIFNDSYSTIGYYSTVGVVKYYGEEGPKIYVDGLSSKNSNIFAGSYVGVFEHPDDPMEKVSQYRFIILQSNGDTVTDTGWIIHNTINDINSLSSNDSFKYDDELDVDKVYYLYYKVITSNNMECSTPGYRILQKNSVGLGLDIGLEAENNFDNGYVSIKITSDDNKITLNGSFEISRQNIKNPKHWEPIIVFVLQAEEPGVSTWKDFTVEQGETYRYCIRQFNSSNMYSDRVISNEVYADFEDAFLFDGQRQLKIRYNPKISSFKNDILETKTDTIGSKYPFIFRNGHVNYKEFPISGLISYWSDEEHLFMPIEDINIVDGSELERAEELPWNLKTTDLLNYNIAAERRFKLEALEWLTNGKPKLFRSPSEGNYIVRLLNTSLTPTDSVGRMLHTFNCMAYEVSEINYNTLAGYGFIKSTLTDDETQREYYRTVPLGWQGKDGETYILTEDETAKPHKNYYYRANDDENYTIFNIDDYSDDEQIGQQWFQLLKLSNLYEIDFTPIITGKNKQYPVDENGCVELLTNPYNKDEVIKASTIRFDDMNSTDIIYINGEKRMIGSTGVYNLDNGDIINSVKVRTIADYYNDDYEADYKAYEDVISDYKDDIAEMQAIVDENTIELQNAEQNINIYLNTAVEENEEIKELTDRRYELKNDINEGRQELRTKQREINEKIYEKTSKELDLEYLGDDYNASHNGMSLIEKKISGFYANSDFWAEKPAGDNLWTENDPNYGLRYATNTIGTVVEDHGNGEVVGSHIEWANGWEIKDENHSSDGQNWAQWEGLGGWSSSIFEDIKVKGKVGVTEGDFSLPNSPSVGDAYHVVNPGTYGGLSCDKDDVIAYLINPENNTPMWVAGKRLKILELRYKIDNIADEIETLHNEIAGVEEVYSAVNGYDGIHAQEVAYKDRVEFLAQVRNWYDQSLFLREVQKRFKELNNFLKDMSLGDALGFGSWAYNHKFDTTYGHYFTEKDGNKASKNWESKFINKAKGKLDGSVKDKKGLLYVQSKITDLEKPFKQDDMPLTNADCQKKIDDLQGQLDDVKEQIENLWIEYNYDYTDEFKEKYLPLNNKKVDLEKEIQKYQTYKADNANAYAQIDSWLKKEKEIKEVKKELDKIHEKIKPLFSLPDTATIKDKDLKVYWKYFTEPEINTTATAMNKKPDKIKFGTGTRTVSNTEKEEITQLPDYLKVRREDFVKGKKYYEYKTVDNGINNSLIFKYEEYTGDQWVKNLYEKNLYKNYYGYVDINTLYIAVNSQVTVLSNGNNIHGIVFNETTFSYYDLIDIKYNYEDNAELITQYYDLLENRDTTWINKINDIRVEIVKLCSEINEIKEVIIGGQMEYDTKKRLLINYINTLADQIAELITEKDNLNTQISSWEDELEQVLADLDDALGAARDAGLEELNNIKDEAQAKLNASIIELKKLKNKLTLYEIQEEPDKRNYIYGNTWDNDIADDYSGIFTYSYIDDYNNTFDLVTNQALLDVPCKQFNSVDSSKNIIEDLVDTRTEVMDILQIYGELKEIENIYLFDDTASMGLLSEGTLIDPSLVKEHFSLNSVKLMNEEDLNLIENPVYIYQIYPILNHSSEEKHNDESGILFGFMSNEGQYPDRGSSDSKYPGIINVEIAKNKGEAEWHSPLLFFLQDSEDNKFYPIQLFSEEEYNSLTKERVLYKENEDGVKELTQQNKYKSTDKYYTLGKQYIHVTYHRGELYYTDLSFYEVVKGEDNKYYLNISNPYYNFSNADMNGYFLVYDITEKQFRITKGYSSKIYVNTGVTNAQLGLDGELYDENDEILEPYLDLSITKEFKTELIPEVTDIYVGNGVILDLSYHARQISYGMEGNNTNLKIAKQKWEKAIEEYTDYFYTKTDRDAYIFDDQILYWDNLFRASDEEWAAAIAELEDKHKQIENTYAVYLQELQKALDAREAQRSWEKFQEVNSNE